MTVNVICCLAAAADVRIYFVLGEPDNHLGLLEAMHHEGLFDKDKLVEGEEYFVVGINVDESWDKKGKLDNMLIKV
jgi:hypothetical protein